jgi:MoxR-like ATPase
VRKCRPGGEEVAGVDQEMGDVGPGPRAVQYLVLGAKARAVLQGSYLARMKTCMPSPSRCSRIASS